MREPAANRAFNVKPASTPILVALSEGAHIHLDKPIMLIGRHQECDIQIPSRKVSRRHCCIAQVGDHLFVRDLSSTNGIRINGVKVVDGALQPDDELIIGNLRYQFKWRAAAPEPKREPTKNGSKPDSKPKIAVYSSSEGQYGMQAPISDVAIVDSDSRDSTGSKRADTTGIKKSDAATGSPVPMEVPENVYLVPLQSPQKP